MYANPRRRHQRGLTLIELIIFIVIVSVGLVGILLVINTVVKSSADPMVRKQSIAMADAILEEVLLKAYADPGDGVSSSSGDCANARVSLDDVDDYKCFDGTTPETKIFGNQMIASSTTYFLPNTFWAQVLVSLPVTVTAGGVGGVAMKKVTVKVTDPSNTTYELSGYRGNY